MFALGIMDKLTPGGLTGGRFIAGTGEISANGAVSPIGGIQQKMAGARAAGATVFLTPAANCPDTAGAVPQGMRLIKVSTLAGAVRALKALRSGGSVPVLLTAACHGVCQPCHPGRRVPLVADGTPRGQPSETDSGDRGRLAAHGRRSAPQARLTWPRAHLTRGRPDELPAVPGRPAAAEPAGVAPAPLAPLPGAGRGRADRPRCAGHDHRRGVDRLALVPLGGLRVGLRRDLRDQMGPVLRGRDLHDGHDRRERRARLPAAAGVPAGRGHRAARGGRLPAWRSTRTGGCCSASCSA